MRLKEVADSNDIREFLRLPLKIYQNDPNYIRPLDDDVEQVFDPQRNHFLQDGKSKRWILLDESGQTIGRIAAFFQEKTASDSSESVGGLGFFECVENKNAAFLMFEEARHWLAEHGMEAMDGPINLGPRDRWWGLLVEGFHPPCYCSNYNPSYYRSFFEEYGFQLYFKQYTYYRRVEDKLRPAHYAIADRFKRNPDYTFSHLKKNNLDKYIRDFLTIYNKAWVNHEGLDEMTYTKARNIVYSLKPVIDERLMWFAYYKEEPIGFFLSIPELNQLFVKYVNGKLDFWGKLRLCWNKWSGKCKTIYGIVFGIVPQHQRKGVEIAMIEAAAKILQNKKLVPYRDVQMNWIGDFNPRMMNVAEQIGGKIYKVHHTYRYLFDRSKEFKRHPTI